MRIRMFEAEDAGDVSLLIRKNLVDVNSENYPKDVINFLHSGYVPKKIIGLSKDRKRFVAVENDTLVGTVSLEGNRVRTLFVDIKSHGMGIGRKLVYHVEKIASKKYAQIEVNSSLTAQKFYEKLGYKKIKENHSDDFVKTINMIKEL